MKTTDVYKLRSIQIEIDELKKRYTEDLEGLKAKIAKLIETQVVDNELFLLTRDQWFRKIGVPAKTRKAGRVKP